MATSWYFYALRADNACGFTWHWRRQRQSSPLLHSGPFDYYYDCIADARKRGYRGAFPAGPRRPVKSLPATREENSQPAERLDITVQKVQSVLARGTPVPI